MEWDLVQFGALRWELRENLHDFGMHCGFFCIDFIGINRSLAQRIKLKLEGDANQRGPLILR